MRSTRENRSLKRSTRSFVILLHTCAKRLKPTRFAGSPKKQRSIVTRACTMYDPTDRKPRSRQHTLTISPALDTDKPRTDLEPRQIGGHGKAGPRGSDLSKEGEAGIDVFGYARTFMRQRQIGLERIKRGH